MPLISVGETISRAVWYFSQTEKIFFINLKAIPLKFKKEEKVI